jgi:hypothetical protein
MKAARVMIMLFLPVSPARSKHPARPAIPSPTGTDVERVMQAKLDPTERWARLACAAV